MSQDLIPVAKAGDYLEVHPSCLPAHRELGWRECERREPADEAEPDSQQADQSDQAATPAKRGRKAKAEAAAEPDSQQADTQALLDAAA